MLKKKDCRNTNLDYNIIYRFKENQKIGSVKTTKEKKIEVVVTKEICKMDNGIPALETDAVQSQDHGRVQGESMMLGEHLRWEGSLKMSQRMCVLITRDKDARRADIEMISRGIIMEREKSADIILEQE